MVVFLFRVRCAVWRSAGIAPVSLPRTLRFPLGDAFAGGVSVMAKTHTSRSSFRVIKPNTTGAQFSPLVGSSRRLLSQPTLAKWGLKTREINRQSCLTHDGINRRTRNVSVLSPVLLLAQPSRLCHWLDAVLCFRGFHRRTGGLPSRISMSTFPTTIITLRACLRPVIGLAPALNSWD